MKPAIYATEPYNKTSLSLSLSLIIIQLPSTLKGQAIDRSISQTLKSTKSMQSHSHMLKFSVCTLKKNTSSNMTSSLPCFRTVITPFQKWKNHRSILQVRAQSYRDEEGRSSNMVDGNLRILKERIEEVRNKERLERCICSRSEQGWNYAPGYNHKYKKEAMLTQCFDLVGLIGGTVGLTILGGSFFLCLISLILHLNQ